MKKITILTIFLCNGLFEFDLFANSNDFSNQNNCNTVNENEVKRSSHMSFDYFEKITEDNDEKTITKHYDIPMKLFWPTMRKITSVVFGNYENMDERIYDLKKYFDNIDKKKSDGIFGDNTIKDNQKSNVFKECPIRNMSDDNCGAFDNTCDFSVCRNSCLEELKESCVIIGVGFLGGLLFCTGGAYLGAYSVIKGTFGIGKGLCCMGKMAYYRSKNAFINIKNNK